MGDGGQAGGDAAENAPAGGTVVPVGVPLAFPTGNGANLMLPGEMLDMDGEDPHHMPWRVGFGLDGIW